MEKEKITPENIEPNKFLNFMRIVGTILIIWALVVGIMVVVSELGS